MNPHNACWLEDLQIARLQGHSRSPEGDLVSPLGAAAMLLRACTVPYWKLTLPFTGALELPFKLVFYALQVNQKRPELARMNQEPAPDKPDRPTTEE